ncbi:MAG TPA: tetratricopeptide repeat protein [Gallionellaceae bacterium]
MKHRHPLSPRGFRAQRNTGLILLVTGLLCACAADKPRKEEAALSKPVAVVAAAPEMTSAVRADFDAAMVHIKAEEYDAGIELLTKVVKAVPNAAVPNIDLALAYKKTGKLKEAEESLQRAISAEADNPVANNELALLYRKTGRLAQARQLYEKILDKYPDYRMVHKNLGILCDLYMKDYECALKHYEFYSNVVQDDKSVKIWIADMKKRLGK